MIPEPIRKLLLCAFVIVGFVSPASAHPHAWIDVKTTVILSAPATVSAIREEWTFDKQYTNSVLKDDSGKWRPLKTFIQSAMDHLKPYSYFIEVHARGVALAIGSATDADGELRNDSLILRFTAPVMMPIYIADSGLTLTVYDPTYYIDFEHLKDHPLSFEGPGAAGCIARIKQATPSVQALSQAAAMDRNAPANPTLGRLFAQTVSIRCS